MKQILIGIVIGAFLIAWFTMFSWMLWRGFIYPFSKLLKKLAVTFWNYPSALAVVAVNAIPLFGVFLFDWKIFEVLYLYWLEVVVYSFFSIAKLKKVLAHTPPEHMPNIRIVPFVIRRGRSSEETMRRIVPEFKATFRFVAVGVLVLIMLISGISIEQDHWFTQTTATRFSFGFLGTPWELLATTLVSLASFSLSHGFSYVRNFLAKEEYRRITLREQLSAPLNRLGVMWIAILGGLFSPAFGRPLAALVTVICIKTAFDVYAHIKEHVKLQVPQPPKVLTGNPGFWFPKDSKV